ncbi:Aste57867_14842 [Aphanomyces stellatus]|uniref:non-specific serine/threonine protein kinase n=1 Tax=Aphanomyces stellatus TaxID=120398 RepID=A0A485L3H1_9STRA|nr:hypothetical protein As57867_014786 [Aphanomyces stellatus]VFT91660.1 Aste57867_14842 [Aphanomyces stellatus]
MNNYREERCIGRGSYGCAYLVTERETGDKYVVKKIPIELMTDKEKQQAFAEVELLAKLRNPFVVQYKENFVEGTVLHIVMGYCDGGDLTARVKQKTIDGGYFATDVVMDWFVQMVLAIKYLHQRHILHRDLKTSNIFLTSKDIVKLGDFGIARTLDSTMDHAKTVVGTPYYMSPEVCESKPYSYASDIWALGCVLYEICALKHAFDAPNILMLIVKIIQHEFVPIPACYPPSMTTLLQALLNKDPDKRPSIDAILRMPVVQVHVDGLRKRGGDLGRHLIEDGQSAAVLPRGWAQVAPVESYEYTYDSTLDGDVVRHASPAGRSGIGGWVDGADEVEEAIEACFDKEELLKPNYESAYSEECSDSIHIDYGKKKMIRRKALTVDDPHVAQAAASYFMQPASALPPLHPSTRPPTKSKMKKKRSTTSSTSSFEEARVSGGDTAVGESLVSNGGDSDNDGPYTSMSDCEADETYYNDDSDEFEDHVLDEDLDFDDHVAEHAYSDDFEDTEAEVIEYDNDEFSSDSDDTSSSGSPTKDPAAAVFLQSYSYDEDFLPSPGDGKAVPSLSPEAT